MDFKQWGITTTRSGNSFIGTFPITLKTVLIGLGQSNSGGYSGVSSLSNTAITINSQWSNNSFNGATKAYFFIIGI